MAKTRPSVQKRNRDAKKLEKAELKAARKAARELARSENAQDTNSDIDPDLIGIVWGPQPTPEDDEDMV